MSEIIGWVCHSSGGDSTGIDSLYRDDNLDVLKDLSTGRTSAVTYSGARDCLPSSFLIRPEGIT
jgi:hypothetical protein